MTWKKILGVLTSFAVLKVARYEVAQELNVCDSYRKPFPLFSVIFLSVVERL